MSSSVVVSDLTKTYRITSTRAPGTRAHGQRRRRETFTALDAVNLTVEQGDVLGIVGRNGAGKSTLLKILSRIVEPDGGEVRLYGRVGSLLEVGTGFHPELTGRENVYLNGAVLGMRRSAISAAFDSIVEFAGVERFLDTPVKRYSSGMYVRLAFAVAAHLDTEILLIDEVLAVGDAAFQDKCLTKIGDVSATEGRTVLFVSHSTAAIEALCSTAIYLRSGSVAGQGDVREVIDAYQDDLFGEAHTGEAGTFDLVDRENGVDATRPVVIAGVRLRTALGMAMSTVETGRALTIDIDLRHLNAVRSLAVVVSVHDSTGRLVTTLSSRMAPSHQWRSDAGGAALASVSLEELPLVPGEYWLSVGAKDDALARKLDFIDRIGPLKVAAGNFFGTGYTPQGNEGAVLLRHDWSFECVSPESR